jgi:hypothetical protein
VIRAISDQVASWLARPQRTNRDALTVGLIGAAIFAAPGLLLGESVQALLVGVGGGLLLGLATLGDHRLRLKAEEGHRRQAETLNRRLLTYTDVIYNTLAWAGDEPHPTEAQLSRVYLEMTAAMIMEHARVDVRVFLWRRKGEESWKCVLPTDPDAREVAMLERLMPRSSTPHGLVFAGDRRQDDRREDDGPRSLCVSVGDGVSLGAVSSAPNVFSHAEKVFLVMMASAADRQLREDILD